MEYGNKPTRIKERRKSNQCFDGLICFLIKQQVYACQLATTNKPQRHITCFIPCSSDSCLTPIINKERKNKTKLNRVQIPVKDVLSASNFPPISHIRCNFQYCHSKMISTWFFRGALFSFNFPKIDRLIPKTPPRPRGFFRRAFLPLSLQ